ncbi:MAG: NAD-dependent epimerase/dehydratase family protein [Cyclobacteriaceae bacterium]|nr:NAD-dependent epimerase/dehydratase family protein [Cyclobacteriaceae bacterium]
MESILVTGACGQLGSELTLALREKYGSKQVIATDIRQPAHCLHNEPFELLDILDKSQLQKLIDKYHITRIFHMAAILSAKAEDNPLLAWELNTTGLLNVLEVARNNNKIKIFWPSSIAVFGPSTPRSNTPQNVIMDPDTVYGISKLACERWCEYYNHHYGVDVRSVRYPGILSYKTDPGGGTTDYAIEIFHKAIHNEPYECFLADNCRLPMMYIDDAVRGTMELMDQPAGQINVRSSYNMAAISFTPGELYHAIKEKVSSLSISYQPDFRQKIAASWPESIDDTTARKEWGWAHRYGLEETVEVMLEGLKA